MLRCGFGRDVMAEGWRFACRDWYRDKLPLRGEYLVSLESCIETVAFEGCAQRVVLWCECPDLDSVCRRWSELEFAEFEFDVALTSSGVLNKRNEAESLLIIFWTFDGEYHEIRCKHLDGYFRQGDLAGESLNLSTVEALWDDNRLQKNGVNVHPV